MFAALFFIFYLCAKGVLNTVAPQVMEKAGWLIRLINTFLLAFLLGLIAGWNKRRYLLGQLGIVSNAILTGAVPEKPFKAGLSMAQDRFHGVGVSKIVWDTLRFLFKTVFKRGREKGEIRTQMLLILQELVSLLVLMFAGIFAHLGACLIVYFYRFPEIEVNIRGMLKAGRRYFKHFGGVLKQLLVSIGIWLGVMAALAVPATLGICKLLKGSLAGKAVREMLAGAFPRMEPDEIGVLTAGIVLILAMLLFSLLVTDPFEKTRMARFYLTCIERDGENADAHFDAGLTRLKGKLRNRVHRHRPTEERETEDSADEAGDRPAETEEDARG